MEDDFLRQKEDAIAPHIFSVSAAMVGVCLTVIGIINLISTYKKNITLADDLTAVNALVFLCSCATSYFSMRVKDGRRRYILERVSDIVFLTGLGMVAFICIFIVLTIGRSAGK
ncbi:MAG: hypothetical protein WCI27_04105 [Candidatus Omnitrophota bacterium]